MSTYVVNINERIAQGAADSWDQAARAVFVFLRREHCRVFLGDGFVVVQRRKINIWAKHRSRKTLQCSHLKNTNTARAAWSQLPAAPYAILSFIDYIGLQWCGTVMSGNQEEKNIVVYNKEALAYVRLWPWWVPTVILSK